MKTDPTAPQSLGTDPTHPPEAPKRMWEPWEPLVHTTIFGARRMGPHDGPLPNQRRMSRTAEGPSMLEQEESY